ALFIAHGANFVVGPNFNAEVARLCNRRKIAYIPGCGSVTEIAEAEEWGVEIVKVFPGNAVGGPDFIKAVLGPRPWSRLMPTGGVKAEEADLRAWFDAGVACVGLGGDLVRKSLIDAGDYDTLAASTRAALTTIRTLRGEAKLPVSIPAAVRHDILAGRLKASRIQSVDTAQQNQIAPGQQCQRRINRTVVRLNVRPN